MIYDLLGKTFIEEFKKLSYKDKLIYISKLSYNEFWQFRDILARYAFNLLCEEEK